MKISIISIGQNSSDWDEKEFVKYKQRVRGSIQLDLIEIPLQKTKKRTLSIIHKESQEMLNACKNHSIIIALSPNGKQLNSDKFAQELSKWQSNGLSVAFLIGGPEGLTDNIIKTADYVWSLSNYTFPHMLVRVILSEQIYRGFCKNINHPYFK